MSKAQELKLLIENEVIPDIEEFIDDLFEVIANEKEATMAQNEELEQMQELKNEFQSILTDIEDDEIEEDEASELIDEIIQMQSEEAED